MIRTTVVLFVLIALCACQGSETPQSRADRCAELDLQISSTQGNDSLEQDAKDEMISAYEQEKAELYCP
jgi:hypothetical protein